MHRQGKEQSGRVLAVVCALAIAGCAVPDTSVFEAETDETVDVGADESALSVIAGYDIVGAPATVDHAAGVLVSIVVPADHSPTDWIGLFPVGASSSLYIDWAYVGAAQSGPFTFTLPHFATVGETYELRYFLDNGYTHAATSESFLVIDVTSPNTVAVSPALPSPGGTFSVMWTAPANHATTDWIGLYRGHAANHEILTYAYVGAAGSTAGEITLTLPDGASPGELYEVRYFPNNTYALSIGAGFAVGNFVGAPTEPVSTPTFTAAWRALPEHSTSDWIGVFALDGDDTAPIDFAYVDAPGATSGTVTLPLPPGSPGDTFELRYFADGSFLRVGTSRPFTTAVRLDVPLGPVASGSTIPIAWSSTSAHASTDWIGLYAVGAPNGAYLTYAHVGVPGQATGSVSLTLPPGAMGAHEARYFTNNTYQLAGRSASFLVE